MEVLYNVSHRPMTNPVRSCSEESLRSTAPAWPAFHTVGVRKSDHMTRKPNNVPTVGRMAKRNPANATIDEQADGAPLPVINDAVGAIPSHWRIGSVPFVQ